MEEKEFERFSAITERLASMEGKLDIFIKNNAYVREAMDNLAERIAKTEASSKSAHRRLDAFEQARKEDKEFMRWVVGVGVTLGGIVSGLVVHFISR